MHTVFLSILVLIAAVGVLGNLLVIFTVALTKRLRVRTNVFTVNLAVADLLVITYVMPVGMRAWAKHSNIFGPEACSANAFLLLTTCAVSIQSLMLVAVERYVHICSSANYERLFQPRAVVLYVAFSWVYSAFWAAQGFTGWTRYKFGTNTYVCAFDEGYSVSYDICFVVFVVLAPMFVLALCYTSVFRCVASCSRKLRSHYKQPVTVSCSGSLSHDSKRRLKRVRRELALIVTLFTIVLAFVVCWTPNVIVFLSGTFWSDMPEWLHTVSMWIAFCNSSINSILYGVLNRNFLAGYKKILHTVFCCSVNGQSPCRTVAHDDDDTRKSSRKTHRLPTPHSASPQSSSPLTHRDDSKILAHIVTPISSVIESHTEENKTAKSIYKTVIRVGEQHC